jgi:hypothetical protein
MSGIAATLSKAARKASGNALPRRSLRRKMPWHARGLRKYLSCACGSRIENSDEEDPASPLGYSEELRVQHSPFDCHRPDFGQRVKASPHRIAAVGVEKSDDVFGHSDSWIGSIGCLSHLADDSDRLKEEAGAFAVESGSFPRDAQVLAWESVSDDIDWCKFVAAHGTDIIMSIYVWPMTGQY